MTWKKKWILPCLLAVFLTGCQGGKQEIPYISDGSVSWDAVEKAEIYGGGCAVPPTGTTVSSTHLDVYKRQGRMYRSSGDRRYPGLSQPVL